MHIDFKCTVWERINVPDELKKEFEEKVRSGEISSSDEAFGVFGDKIDGLYESLPDTGEQMNITENDMQSTVELWDDKEDIIWDNSKDKI